jgi:hypothetical protein
MYRSANKIQSALIMSVWLVYTILLFLNNNVSANTKPVKNHGKERVETPAMTIKEALMEYTEKLMSLPGVVGTAQGLCDGNPCIKVYVVNKTQQLEKQIHRILKGYSYQVRETGKFRPRPE